MPYIRKFNRELIKTGPMEIRAENIETAGDLNFAFTMLIDMYVLNKGECYQIYNDVVGALEGAKLELYRRKIGIYEDKKIKENGDVYASRKRTRRTNSRKNI